MFTIRHIVIKPCNVHGSFFDNLQSQVHAISMFFCPVYVHQVHKFLKSICYLLKQIAPEEGPVNFYVAKDTYPGPAYYEDMITGTPGKGSKMQTVLPFCGAQA